MNEVANQPAHLCSLISNFIIIHSLEIDKLGQFWHIQNFQIQFLPSLSRWYTRVAFPVQYSSEALAILYWEYNPVLKLYFRNKPL